MSGCECVTERSPTSESTYLHLRRGGHWYGIRVSAHPPAYACSRDYASVIVPRNPTDAVAAELTATVVALTRRNAAVVADPREVRRATRRLEDFLLTGRRCTDTRGVRWEWSAERRAWSRVDGQAPPPGAAPPTHRPRSLLSNRNRSAVRHSQNALAKYAAELCQDR